MPWIVLHVKPCLPIKLCHKTYPIGSSAANNNWCDKQKHVKGPRVMQCLIIVIQPRTSVYDWVVNLPNALISLVSRHGHHLTTAIFIASVVCECSQNLKHISRKLCMMSQTKLRSNRILENTGENNRVEYSNRRKTWECVFFRLIYVAI